MKLFNRKQKSIPSSYKEPYRYKDRPLFIVLENYVLDCINELSPEEQSSLTEIVQRVFGGGDDWKQTVRQELQLSDSIDENIRQLWERNQQIAKEANTTLTPVQFAKMFVDTNFAHLVD